MINRIAFFKLIVAIILIELIPFKSQAQLIMNATNGSNAYTVINGKLAPGYTSVEAPDQTTGNSVVGTHPSFGRHIAMVYDATAPNTTVSSSNPNPNYVFEFYIHPLNDNDVSTGDADRQRVEMKTYNQSPDSLKGTQGETITYTWYFRLAAGFQPSPTFTHIHQIKAVSGDISDPIFTITPTATSSGNVVMVRYVADSAQGNSSTPYTMLASAPLSSFTGTWVQVTEIVKVDSTKNGFYSIVIKKVSDNSTIISYATSKIKTMRSSNAFIRPKWGIYRSIANISYLRDDTLRIASVSINEHNTISAPAAPTSLNTTPSTNAVALSWTSNSSNDNGFIIERSANGSSGWSYIGNVISGVTNYTDAGLNSGQTFYYRVYATNPAGNSAYSNIANTSTTTPSTSPLTYYWIGGINGAWGSAASWNTKQDASGTNRTIADPSNDILIIDGRNVGGASTLTGQITPTITGSESCAQLQFVNGADVVFSRSTNSGTSTFSVNGDGTFAYKDFYIDSASSLKITCTTSGYGFNITMGGNASGTVYGTLRITDVALARAYITVAYVSALNFSSGSKCYINNNFSTSSYPFTSSSGSTITGGIVFKAGSFLYDLGGVSPYPNSTSFPIAFESGSTLEIDGTLTTTALFAGRIFSNLIISNGTTVTAEGNPFNIDNLTINAGSTLTLRTTGTYPVSGNIVNNGTLNCASGYTSTNLVLIGSTPQTVSGNAFSVAAFCVGADANVTLNTNVNIGSASGTPTSSVTGKLNVGTNVISSTSVTTPGPFQLRVAASVTTPTATVTSGTDTIKLPASVFASGVNTANVAIGCLVTGTGIQNNTYVVQTNSGSSYFLISKPATQNFLSNNGTITITNYAATLVTANTNGIDGSITTSGTKTFGNGANYIFNAATTTPFPASLSSLTANNLTFNAAATLNKPLTVNAVLNVTAGTLNTDVNSLTLTATTASADFYPGTSLSVASGSVTNFNGNNVVLESSSTGTASIGTINGTLSGANNVTVQQFIPSGYRKFRLLGHPYASALALNQLTDNIDITGTGGSANGFTTTTTNNPSAFYFNTATADGNGLNDAGWNAFANTTTANWNVGQGIRALIRGTLSQAGSLDGSVYTPDSVVLDMNGTINQGNVSVNLTIGGSGSTQGFNLVSNPYPSPVDIGSVVNAAANVVKTIYLRNPQTGSYTTQVISGAYTIPANTAFFIKANSNTSLNFSETNKSTCTSCAVVFGETDKNFIQLKAMNNNIEYDNFYVLFNNNAKELYEPTTDAVKLINDGLTLYTISSDKQKLAADYRSGLSLNNVIPVGIMLPASYGKQSYQLAVSDYSINGMKLSLHDKLTNTYTAIEKDAVYVLDVDPSNPLSIGENRLEIIITKSNSNTLTADVSLNTSNVIAVLSNNKITVKYVSAESVNTNIKLVALNGQTIETHNLGMQQQGQLEMNAANLSQGTYLVEVKLGDKTTTKKVIKF